MAAGKRQQKVDLVCVAELLHEHLTGSLVAAAFEDLRSSERERIWTLQQMVAFWTAVILRAPKSLSEALREASGDRSSGFPPVETSHQAFFKRCRDLRWEFFAKVFRAFVRSVSAKEPPRFARHHQGVADRFGQILVLDGSDLDPVARRLKVLWGNPAAPLPGTILACYDLMRGTLEDLLYSHTLKKGELTSAREVLGGLRKGCLILGDRLYGTPKFLAELCELGLFGVVRRQPWAHIEVRKSLGSLEYEGGVLEDSLVVWGKAAKLPARLVRFTMDGKVYEFLTNVTDPASLSAVDIVDLYRDRWQVERLFFDLKEVLNLHCFYCGNANAVAMQLYAAAIVHTALRVGQGRIAEEASIEPEDISEAKLFPLLSATSATLVTLEMGFLLTKEANPGIDLKKPDWHGACNLNVPLGRILADKSRGNRPRTTAYPQPTKGSWTDLPAPPGSKTPP